MKTVIVHTLDTSGSNRIELEVDSTYECELNNDGGYGIIVIDDTLRLSPGIPVGTYDSNDLTLVGNQGAIDLMIGDNREKMNLNARLLYLKTTRTGTELAQVTVLKPR